MIRLLMMKMDVVRVLILLLVTSPGTVSTRPASMCPMQQSNPVMTAYACENSQLEISCPCEHHAIRVIRANYGRIDLNRCNEHRRMDLDVDCMTPRAVSIVARRCNNLNGCQITVNLTTFGGVDWCPDTPKYAEVTYVCYLVVHPTGPSQLNVKTFPSRASTVGWSSQYPLKMIPTQSPSSSKRKELATTTVEFATNVSPIRKVFAGKFCQSKVVRNIVWPNKPVDNVHYADCPQGSQGIATWKCGSDGQWSGLPNLGDCQSPWIQRFDTKISQGDAIADISTDLAKTVSTNTLYGGDLVATTQTMNNIVGAAGEQLQNKTSMQIRDILRNVTKALVQVGSTILSANRKESWTDLKEERQSELATQIVHSLEVLAHKMADSTNEPEDITQLQANIALEVKVLNSSAEQRQHSVTVPGLYLRQNWNSSDYVSLDSEVLNDHSKNGLAKIVYIAYNNMGQWMTGNSGDSKQFIASKVFTLSVDQYQPVHPIIKPVRYLLKHIQKFGRSGKARCVYWHYNASSFAGTWSGSGCHVVSTNASHTVCSCDHLTNFAVLMDVSGTKLPEHHEIPLQVITYACCIVSIVCLILSLVTFNVFGNLQSDRTSIHKNLVFCLLVANTVFLLGILQTADQMLCAVVAGTLHFFFLAAFSWMCLEGIQLYMMLIEVFEAKKSRILHYYLAGYGIPSLIVLISAIVDKDGYGTDRHCWLKVDGYFVWSFVGPACLVITTNIIMLSIAVYMMCRHTPATPALTGASRCKLEQIKSWIKGAAVLVVLLGLTWSFGLLYINEDTVAMAYVFIVFNSLQGVFIFVFHCLLNEKVQKEYKRWARHHSWLPDCVRVQYGYSGQKSDGSPTPSSSSSGPAHYFQKLLTSRKRRRSAGSCSGKSATTSKSPLHRDFYQTLSQQENAPLEYTLSSVSHRAAMSLAVKISSQVNSSATDCRIHGRDDAVQLQYRTQPEICPIQQNKHNAFKSGHSLLAKTCGEEPIQQPIDSTQSLSKSEVGLSMGQEDETSRSDKNEPVEYILVNRSAPTLQNDILGAKELCHVDKVDFVRCRSSLPNLHEFDSQTVNGPLQRFHANEVNEHQSSAEDTEC